MEKTFEKITIELFGLEKDIELLRAGWKNRQIIAAERQIINGRKTNRCNVKEDNGKIWVFYLGFNCRLIPTLGKPEVTKQEVMELLEGFLKPNFLWISFKAYVKDKGYTLDELGLQDE